MSTAQPYADRLVTILQKYIKNPEAVVVALSLHNSIRSARKVLLGEASDEAKFGVMTMLTDMSLVLPANTFWQRYGASVLPVFNVAVNGFLDSVKLMDFESRLPPQADRVELRVRIMALQFLVWEVPVAILYCDRNPVDARKLASDLRQDLQNLGW